MIREEDVWDEQKVEDHKNYHRLLTKQYYCDPSRDEVLNYNKLKIENNKAHIICSKDPEVFKKFIFLYTINTESTLKSYSVEDYISDHMKKELDITRGDVLILSYHAGFSTHGNKGKFAHEQVIEVVINRNRRSEVSMLLVEKNPVYYDESSKMNINLLSRLKDEARIIHLGVNMEELEAPPINNIIVDQRDINTNQGSVDGSDNLERWA